MKSIHEVLTYCLGEKPRQKFAIAANYLQGQLEHIPEEKQLEWAKERRDRDVWGDKYGLEITNYYLNNDLEEQFEYSAFIHALALLCIEFYEKNGGEMHPQTKRALENNSYHFNSDEENIPNVISEGKNGEGKFIVSSIL